MIPLKKIPSPKGRLFAIGDIHGCFDETEILLNWLERNEGLCQDDLVIFIGDYIDRGPNSMEVVDLLVEFKKKFPSTVFLKGNHEDMLFDFLGFGGSNGDVFIKNGGGTTLESYGLSENCSPEDFLAKLPNSHREFFSDLESFIDCMDYYFAHAGLNPRRLLRRQIADDLYWIREGFLDESHRFGKPIIFGHTPHADVVFDLPYKIGIDTGLVYGNMLTCVELKGRRIYQIASRGRDIVISVFPAYSSC